VTDGGSGWKLGPDRRVDWLHLVAMGAGAALFAGGAVVYRSTSYDTLGLAMAVVGLAVLALYGLTALIP
jgi:hypothetical protein